RRGLPGDILDWPHQLPTIPQPIGKAARSSHRSFDSLVAWLSRSGAPKSIYTVRISDSRLIENVYTESPKQRGARYCTILQTFRAPGSVLAPNDHDAYRQQ
ncbi:hypothetical protein DOTSEDRAFT_71930, partial [Dothistroma septosporum NZE10]